MRKRRGLRPEDRALWQRVTRSVAPLRPTPAPAQDGEPATTPSAARASAATDPRVVEPRALRPAQSKRGNSKGVPQPSDLDRKLRRKLARGTAQLDARIDLHGMTQEEAQRALISFMAASLSRGHKLVLVITGKGKSGSGILRRAVPQWLDERAMRRVVVSYGPASAAHGGDGALYVRLRAIDKAKRV